jgi:hypothetical protein
MKRNAFFIPAVLGLSILAGAGALMAQQGGGRGWGMGPGMMEDGMGRGMMGEGWGRGRGGMGMGMGCPMVAFGDDGETTTFVDGRIAFLKAELKITDAQNNAWDGYAAAMKSNLDTMTSMHQLMQTAFEAKTPVERLDTRVAAMETRLNALKEMKPALETLYGVLDEEQKETANEVLTEMGCMM